MTSTDDRDRRIRALYASGQSAILIGREVGLSRSQVHRIIAAAPVEDTSAEDDDDDWPDADEVPSGLVEPIPVVEPVTSCGREWSIRPQGRGEEPLRSRVERWTDARGQSVNDLSFYRHRQRLRERAMTDKSFDAEAAVRAFNASLDRQRELYEQRRRNGPLRSP